jgi:hypothetical protein
MMHVGARYTLAGRFPHGDTMPNSKILLIDSLVNFVLGVLLVTFPKSVVHALGVPTTDMAFYPSVFGGVLLGIAVALVVEHFRKRPSPIGLGLAGAVSINLCGATVLIGWLIWGELDMPLRGRIFLWVLSAGLFLISGSELLAILWSGNRKDS